MVFCSCGKQAITRTSWTERNPGRRFYACPKQGSKCQFIGWLDPPMCERATLIIPGLLRSKNELESQVKKKGEEVKKWKKLFVVSCIVFVVFFFLF